LASFLVSVVGAVSLVVPTVSLTYISSISMKIVFVSVSILVFAGLLTLFTNSKNQELFVATAAYGAVLVVFVGNPRVPSS
jgi:hypothetical protein